MSNRGAASATAVVKLVNGSTAILVSEKQRGNPLLRFIRNCPFEFNRDIVPDYVMGSTCAIFLSLKYHLLHPRHAEVRIKELGRSYKLRILLVLVDDDNNVRSLQELNKLCFSTDVTLILAWNNEECARYLETFKLYENKDASAIKEKVKEEFMPQLTKGLY
jgi:DNA excision repair protein ERCC-1